MREHDLQPACVADTRQRRIATTTIRSSANLAKDIVVSGANQLWVADITYVAVATGFVYLAVILDAWSRRVAATPSAWTSVPGSSPHCMPPSSVRRPPPGCLHHSDRGSQYAAQAYRASPRSLALSGEPGGAPGGGGVRPLPTHPLPACDAAKASPAAQAAVAPSARLSRARTCAAVRSSGSPASALTRPRAAAPTSGDR